VVGGDHLQGALRQPGARHQCQSTLDMAAYIDLFAGRQRPGLGEDRHRHRDLAQVEQQRAGGHGLQRRAVQAQAPAQRGGDHRGAGGAPVEIAAAVLGAQAAMQQWRIMDHLRHQPGRAAGDRRRIDDGLAPRHPHDAGDCRHGLRQHLARCVQARDGRWPGSAALRGLADAAVSGGQGFAQSCIDIDVVTEPAELLDLPGPGDQEAGGRETAHAARSDPARRHTCRAGADRSAREPDGGPARDPWTARYCC
jgi:hypothetical protein